MPAQNYRTKQLSRLLTNELFRAIESSDITVTDFELIQRLATIRWRTRSLIGLWADSDRNHESRSVTVIYHSPSRSDFRIMQVAEHGFVYRSLTDSSMAIEEELQTEWLLRWSGWSSWKAVKNSFGE
jgi:hypothetical protein